MIGKRLSLSHAFHPLRPCRTLRIRRKRRLPPARERLAQHSGDGGRGIVGPGREGGDATRLKPLMRLRWRGEIIPVVRVFYRLCCLSPMCS
ncbi:hypothetical protein D3C87_1839170 [compost metagenome]